MQSGQKDEKKVIKNIIFDLGGVLIDWNPDYVFKKLIKNKTDRDFSTIIFAHLSGTKTRIWDTL